MLLVVQWIPLWPPYPNSIKAMQYQLLERSVAFSLGKIANRHSQLILLPILQNRETNLPLPPPPPPPLLLLLLLLLLPLQTTNHKLRPFFEAAQSLYQLQA